MKTPLILVVLLASILTHTSGQITTTKVSPKEEKIGNNTYDSTKNFLGSEVYNYVGQVLYLKGLPENQRKNGYRNFYIDYKKATKYDRNNVYKANDAASSKYDELANKYFAVLDVLKHPESLNDEAKYGSKHFLKLKEQKSNDIVFFEYDSRYFVSFPFIVVGYYEKGLERFVGQKFMFHNRRLENSIDIDTGKPITHSTGQLWKCIDITFEETENDLVIVIQNLISEKTVIPLKFIDPIGIGLYRATDEQRAWGIYTQEEVDYYINKFGQNDFHKILEGSVSIGMTTDMCRLSWGEPRSINPTITSTGRTEQWVYSKNYLYFENDILVAIQ